MEYMLWNYVTHPPKIYDQIRDMAFKAFLFVAKLAHIHKVV